MAQRRTHRKSKLGCQHCKRRHIKCDEGQPSCSNCTNTERECVYVAPRPRRVHSRSPHPSNMDVGIHSATGSPSSTLLHPMAATVSTPTSNAASPVFTPASSTQLDFSNLDSGLCHLELLTNFILEVAPSLDNEPFFGIELMRNIMPVILSKQFLLLEVLALSALHLSRVRPGQADKYLAGATSMQIEALTLFDEQLGSVTVDNCAAMFLFAGLLGTHALGEAVMNVSSDADSFLDRFIRCLNLHRGTKMVASQAWPLLLQSNMSFMLHTASDQLKLAESHDPEEAVFVASELGRLLDSGDMSADSNTACRDAVAQLKLTYQADDSRTQFVETKRRSTDLIWSWPTLLSGGYTDLLQKRQPEALIILCYFAVLLHRRQNLWFVGGAGRMLIESVTRSLGSFWRHWLDWPNEAIGNGSTSFEI
ncbi:hypothetical protein C7974DRAFT_169172 [Boeremia exigua]|uniref:uncharacterized protein n=1 Tax=Boeremia exigua TaxID=749465 RepID=UPI001E8EBC85|nr:uncharacterized protein C7974DRAFT_169172 [Boeremia exigua]KAH6633305.1 hypothetical protein C7974DRAFT_169172 [Boeremia exigua]